MAAKRISRAASSVRVIGVVISEVEVMDASGERRIARRVVGAGMRHGGGEGNERDGDDCLDAVRRVRGGVGDIGGRVSDM